MAASRSAFKGVQTNKCVIGFAIGQTLEKYGAVQDRPAFLRQNKMSHPEAARSRRLAQVLYRCTGVPSGILIFTDVVAKS